MWGNKSSLCAFRLSFIVESDERKLVRGNLLFHCLEMKTKLMDGKTVENRGPKISLRGLNFFSFFKGYNYERNNKKACGP